MPAEESKLVDPPVDETDVKGKGKQPEIESEEEEDDEPAGQPASAPAEGPAPTDKKKKRSKRKKVKDALTGGSGNSEDDLKKAISNLPKQQLQEMLALNPALASEVAHASGTSNPSPQQAADAMKKLNLQDIMTGLAAGGKNVKEMGSYKFWQTQPVPRFDEKSVKEEGPLRIQTVEEVDKNPAPLVPGYEWVTVDLKDDAEIKEVYELLNGHYVEDDEAMFRFNYSPSILRW